MSKQGLIYEIVCNITGERYIGSTFHPTVAKRIVEHRKIYNMCCSKIIIERGDYKYGLLETIFVNSRDELRMCERKWYDTLECINIHRPYISKEELIQLKRDNTKQYRETYKEEQKQYREDHKEESYQRQKQYCENHKEELYQRQK